MAAQPCLLTFFTNAQRLLAVPSGMHPGLKPLWRGNTQLVQLGKISACPKDITARGSPLPARASAAAGCLQRPDVVKHIQTAGGRCGAEGIPGTAAPSDGLRSGFVCWLPPASSCGCPRHGAAAEQTAPAHSRRHWASATASAYQGAAPCCRSWCLKLGGA